MLQLFKIKGIPVKIHWSYSLLVFWCFLVGSTSTFSPYFTVGMLTASIFFHELGHALVALKYKKEVGSIVFNFIGGFTQIKGLGVSEKEDIAISIAGPLTNLALAILAIPLIYIVNNVDYVLYVLFFIYANIFLFLNIIPIFPLDGGMIINSLFRLKYKEEKALKYSTAVGSIVGLIASLASLFFGFPIFCMFFSFLMVANSSNYYFKVKHER